ncbi:MAG: hypothetical protein ACJ76L_10825 [Conexibacter sp.]
MAVPSANATISMQARRSWMRRARPGTEILFDRRWVRVIRRQRSDLKACTNLWTPSARGPASFHGVPRRLKETLPPHLYGARADSFEWETEMRRQESTRHGRAADALIASYLRELLVDDGQRADTTRLPTPIAANREIQGAPLGAQRQSTEAEIRCGLE